jgi:hypothetical protein
MTLNLHALVQRIMMQGLRWKWLDHFHSLWLRSIQFNWTEGTFDFSPLHFTMPLCVWRRMHISRLLWCRLAHSCSWADGARTGAGRTQQSLSLIAWA